MAANYIEAGSELKTKIEIAYPMQPLEQTHTKTVGENTTEVSIYSFHCSSSLFMYCIDYHCQKINLKKKEDGITCNREFNRIEHNMI